MAIFPPGFNGPEPQPPPPFDASDFLSWKFKPAAPTAAFGQTAQSALSSEPQKLLIHAQTASGADLTPSEIAAMGVQIAFKTTGEPQESDWHDMRVGDTTEGGTYYAVAFIRVGLGGATGSAQAGLVNLAPGTYQRRVRVKATPHVVGELPPFVVKG